MVDVLTYIGQRSPIAAFRPRDRLVLAFDRLTALPSMGHRRPDLTNDASFRFWRVGRLPIAYRRPEDNRIEVVRVLDASRDVATILEED